MMNFGFVIVCSYCIFCPLKIAEYFIKHMIFCLFIQACFKEFPYRSFVHQLYPILNNIYVLVVETINLNHLIWSFFFLSPVRVIVPSRLPAVQIAEVTERSVRLTWNRIPIMISCRGHPNQLQRSS